MLLMDFSVLQSLLLDYGLILLFVSLTSYYILHPYFDPKRKNLPPGPTGIPIFGYAPFLPSDYQSKLKQLFAKYGQIFSMRLGSFDVVFISDFEVIKKAMKQDVFNHRPYPAIFGEMSVPILANVNDEEWKEQRKFSVRVMRELGMGRQEFEDVILDEVDDVIQKIEKQEDGKGVNVHRVLGSAVTNAVNFFITGSRLRPEDPIRQLIDDSFLPRGHNPSMFSLVFFMHVFRIMRYIPYTRMWDFYTRWEQVVVFMRERSAALKQKSEMEEVTCFIDFYNREMKDKNRTGKFFDEDHLIGNAFTILVASAVTTSDVLTWFFLILTVYPEVQNKLSQEVDDVIGSNRPSLKYRESMPYTEAVMHEVHRFVSSNPSALPHSVSQDVWLEGYFLPKGTQVVYSPSEVHSNPDYFPGPEKFLPERHISSDGKFVKNEKVMSFGTGKRLCPGEGIAHASIFLCVTSFVQTFVIECPKGRKYGTQGVTDLVARVPADFPVEIVFKRR